MKSMNFRVLNLGAGIQSTTIYLMICDGILEPIDVAIFADTGEEPAAVYEHVEFLKLVGGPKIVTVSAGKLGDDLIKGINSAGQRFVSIPSFVASNEDGGKGGIGRRQCTKEYKIEPIEKEIRKIVGAVPGRPIPPGVNVTQIMGLSFDEPSRVEAVRNRFQGRKHWFCEFPLFDRFIERTHCHKYLAKRLPGRTVPRSACVFCPYRSDAEWVRLRDEDPQGFARAVDIDRAIRLDTSACSRGMKAKQFIHRSCIPLDEVEFVPKPPDNRRRIDWFEIECSGMCGM